MQVFFPADARESTPAARDRHEGLNRQSRGRSTACGPRPTSGPTTTGTTSARPSRGTSTSLAPAEALALQERRRREDRQSMNRRSRLLGMTGEDRGTIRVSLTSEPEARMPLKTDANARTTHYCGRLAQDCDNGSLVQGRVSCRQDRPEAEPLPDLRPLRRIGRHVISDCSSSA